MEFSRPFDSYDNTEKEGYGTRGGQDLVLIKLSRKTKYLEACLPSNSFQDTNLPRVVLSGYGKYHRADCQTDGRGPMKFHYCQSDPDCVDHNCKPHFSDGIRDHTDCVKGEKTPAKWSRLCSRYLLSTSLTLSVNIFLFLGGSMIQSSSTRRVLMRFIFWS